MAEDFGRGENGTEDVALHNRKSSAKAFKTLGVDTSAEKQRKMLGLDDASYHKALKEAAESIDEPLAGGHSIEIPDEQIEAQLAARRTRIRSQSHSSDSRPYLEHYHASHMGASSSDYPGHDSEHSSSILESGSIDSEGNGSGNARHSAGAARNGRRTTGSRELEEDSEEASWDKKRWRSPSARGLIDADHEDGPLSTSAPHRYFYYYYDGTRKHPRRRRASFGEPTPMIDKRANRKALYLLGIDPSEEKVMDILGINGTEELQNAVADAQAAEAPKQELPRGRPVQPKALVTLGIPQQFSKVDLLLGRFDAPNREMIDVALSFHLDMPFL